MTGGAVHDGRVGTELKNDIIGCAVIGDGGYDSNEFLREPEGNNNRAVIAGRKKR